MLSSNFLEELKKTENNLRIGGVPAEIRTGHIPNKSYTHRLSKSAR
jgi:hypothetical protein